MRTLPPSPPETQPLSSDAPWTKTFDWCKTHLTIVDDNCLVTCDTVTLTAKVVRLTPEQAALCNRETSG